MKIKFSFPIAKICSYKHATLVTKKAKSFLKAALKNFVGNHWKYYFDVHSDRM